MYLRAVGRRFTQMNAYFLVMNSKRCNISIVRTVNGKGFTGKSLSANLEGRKFAFFRSNNPRWSRCD